MNWVRDSGLYFIARAVPGAVGLLLAAALVRIIGTTGYGAYALAFSAANLVSVFGVGWLTQATLRFQPAGGEAAESFHGTMRRAGLLSALACVVLVAMLFALSSKDLHGWTVIVAGGLLVFGLSTHAVYAASLQASSRAAEVAALETGRAVVSLPLACWLAYELRPGFMGAIAGIGLSYLLSGVTGHFLVGRALRIARTSEDAISRAAMHVPLPTMISYGWMMSVWLAISLSLPYLERMVLAKSLDIESLGVYAAVYDVIFRGCGFLMLPIVLALHPRILRGAASHDLAARVRLWRAGILSQLAIAVIVVLAVCIAAPHILRLLGMEASGTHQHLAILLAIAGCLWQIALMAHKLLEATLSTLAMVVVLAISIAACVLADIIVAPRFGLVAVAYALAASGLLYCLVVIVIGRARVARSLAAVARGS